MYKLSMLAKKLDDLFDNLDHVIRTIYMVISNPNELKMFNQDVFNYIKNLNLKIKKIKLNSLHS